MARKVIQISAVPEHVYALCDDGTIWDWNTEGRWKEWPPTKEIPQPQRPKVKQGTSVCVHGTPTDETCKACLPKFSYEVTR